MNWKKKVGELSEKLFLLCWTDSCRKVTEDLVRKEGNTLLTRHKKLNSGEWWKGWNASYTYSPLSDTRLQLKFYLIETHLKIPWLFHDSNRLWKGNHQRNTPLQIMRWVITIMHLHIWGDQRTHFQFLSLRKQVLHLPVGQ